MRSLSRYDKRQVVRWKVYAMDVPGHESTGRVARRSSLRCKTAINELRGLDEREDGVARKPKWEKLVFGGGNGAEEAQNISDETRRFLALEARPKRNRFCQTLKSSTCCTSRPDARVTFPRPAN
jgi:hypothetical protein